MTLRFGGVPEHFNYPWHLAIKQGFSDRHGKLSISWRDVLGGTGSMRKKLVENELDVAIMLTEGALKFISDGDALKVIGTYVKSPLLWGIHVPTDSSLHAIDQLEGQPIAISRKGSGSHLMSFVLAEQQGWSLEELEFVLVKNFEGARESFAKNESSVFLWEKFTTKPVVDSGEWRRIGVIPTPWPCFVMVARKEIAEKYSSELIYIMDKVRKAQLSLNDDETIDYLNEKYEQKKEDLEKWFEQTEWECKARVSGKDFASVQMSLYDLGLIDGIRENAFFLSDFCQIY